MRQACIHSHPLARNSDRLEDMPVDHHSHGSKLVPTVSRRSDSGELLAMAAALAPGQLTDSVPTPAHAVAAEWPDDTRSLLLWLTRIRPQSRARYLSLLTDFLAWSGIDSPDRALQHARSDAAGTRQIVRKYVLEVDDRRSERLFAYSALRSFFARGHCPLPGDASFDVGGMTSSWWVRSGRPADVPTPAEGNHRDGDE